MRRTSVWLCAAFAAILTGLSLAAGSAPPVPAARTPIKHVVIIEEENHSFDNLLGKFCYQVSEGNIFRPGKDSRCSGAHRGLLPDGSRPPLAQTPDTGLSINHGVKAQITEIDGGKMDGWARAPGCSSGTHPAYACMTAFGPIDGTCGTDGTQTCIPNLVHYATDFTVADHSFEFVRASSWAGHMILASATLDGFQGDNPTLPTSGGAGGWGCDSGQLAPWWNGTKQIHVPSCVPDTTGDMGSHWTGYSGAHAPYVPTMFDTFDLASVSWKIYGGAGGPGSDSGYIWTICPTYFECLGSSQDNHLVPADQLVTDAQAGQLPKVSFVSPITANSTHEPASVSVGDNWLGTVIGGLMNSSAWASTAIFLTWDDCGCFYDHVNPLAYNPHYGPRLPMVIISPYAKQGYTDPMPTSVMGVLGFIEQTFKLPPLNPCAGSQVTTCMDDANSYDFSNAFDYSQTPLPGIPSVRTAIPRRERAWLRAHPGAGNEPT